ncbi:MAG TPA: EAL domain-containing protein [Burkholderiaceae bacterium]|nr:EAL domain-containing protein [Burkholderiaceae bacterium]
MAEPLKVLLVEDEPSDAELVMRELKRAGIVCVGCRVDTERAFRHELAHFDPNIILSDFNMPQFDGMAALSIAHTLRPDIPFIFVSGTLGEDYAIRALKSGATDYVLKDNLVRLPPATHRALQDAKAAAEQRRMQAALHHSEQRFRLAASTGDVWDWTVATGEAHFSRQWKEKLGYEDHEVANSSEAWLALLHPDDRESVLRAFRAHVLHKVPYDIEYRCRTKAGDYRWSYSKGLALWNTEDRATYMAGTVVDIHERKLAEIKVRRLNRVYAVLSGINALIVRVRHREELFRDACRIAVDAGEFRLAWIGLVDWATMQVKPVAWCGVGDDYIRKMPLSLNPDRQGSYGFAGTVVAERKPVVIESMTTDPRVVLRDEAREHGFHSVALLPLLVEGEAIGALALYSAEVGFFDAEEMRLLLELASDIAFALDHIDKAERLNYLAYYDALTGLANQSLFYERLSQHIEAAKRERHKFAVLAINVDRFQKINDTLGRQAGDDLLKQIAKRFLGSEADHGRHARIDADHFAVVIPDIKSEEELARQIEQKAREYFGPPFRIGEAELRITVRVGVALYPTDGTDPEALFRNAEAAMKRARTRGELYLFYAQEMTEKIAGTLALENKLRLAMEKDEFVLYYQPKVDTLTRRIVGVEALIRWQNPELGLVSPLQFIPLMEETGMIVEVGAWALCRAALDHNSWEGQGFPVPRVAVNLSPVQLRRSDFVDTVRLAVALGNGPPGIDLEITESLIMEDIEANIDKLQQVRELGLGIAVDDFGTGYSSLRYLAKLPVQTLKIDRSFIVTMQHEEDTMTLVATVISLAHSLRLKVVAEGVETEEQAAILEQLECDQLQGYLFARPLPLADITALLRASAKLGGAP